MPTQRSGNWSWQMGRLRGRALYLSERRPQPWNFRQVRTEDLDPLMGRLRLVKDGDEISGCAAR